MHRPLSHSLSGKPSSRTEVVKHLSFWSALALSLLPAREAAAFKAKTHVATANATLDRLSSVISAGSEPDILRFSVNGKFLEIPVRFKEAYAAILAQPEAFRAGSVGPDGYLDPMSGQLWAHGNQSPTLRDIVQQITGTAPPSHGIGESLEHRHGLSELRSIDFATAMLSFYETGYAFPGGEEERQQALAFIMGYLAHGVGDGFAHTWVNEIAGGAWNVSDGSGLFGPASEEVKHMAVERFVDALVPSGLVDGAAPRQRLTLHAPLAFLDAFYASPVSAAIVPDTAARDSSPEGFADFYSRVDMFYGGPVTSFFNAQAQLGSSARGWSRVGPVFDLAERFQETDVVGTFLDVADFPAQLMQDLTAAVPAVDPLSVVTFGVVDCHDPIGGGGGGSTGLERLRAIWRFLGTMNDRLDVYAQKAEVVRRNWLQLAECTIQNVTNLDCSDSIGSGEGAVRDACGVLSEQPFRDEGNPHGLYRGALRPESSPDVAEFLLDLRSAYRGEAGFEASGGHARLGGNLERMLDFLTGTGLVLDDFAHVLLPPGSSDGGGSILDEYQQFCAQVRDQGFENCLDLQLAPIAATGRQVACLAEHTECVLQAQEGCLEQACNSACVPPLPCGGLCGDSGGCGDQCSDLFCLEVCPPIVGCFEVCEPVTYATCNAVCSIFSEESDSCFDTAVDSAECVAQQVECDIDNLVSTVTLDNFAEELLTPMRRACDQVDDALAFVRDCMATPEALEACVCDLIGPSQCAQLQKAKQQAQQLAGLAAGVQDEVCKQPAHSLVNLAFLYEDMLDDPLYLSAIAAGLPEKQAEVQALPDGPDKTEKQEALTAFADLVADAQAAEAGNPVPLLMDPDNPTTVVARAYELGLIPVILGPTAQRIASEVGSDMPETFHPFFNSVQGMLIAGLRDASELEELFLAEGVDATRLPLHQPALFSAACSASGANPYCDVIASFDDPNCIDCADQLPVAPFDWIPGRSVVAYEPLDAALASPSNVLTGFPFASSQPAYERFYEKIFRVPGTPTGDVQVALGTAQPDMYQTVLEMVADEANLYALHFYQTKSLPNISSEPGELVVLNRDTLRVERRLPLGHKPRALALNPETHRLYVIDTPSPAAPIHTQMHVVDTTTLTEVASLSIRTAQAIADVAVNPRTNRVYLANTGIGIIQVIDGTTHAELPQVAIGLSPVRLAVDESTNTVFAAMAHRPAPEISALGSFVDDGTTTVIQPFVHLPPIGTIPQDVAFDPVTRRVYVTGLGSPNAPPSVSVIDVDTDTVLGRIQLPAPGRAIALSPSHQRAFVAADGRVTIIDTNTQAVVANVPTPTAFAVAAGMGNEVQLYAGGLQNGTVRRLLFDAP